MAGVSTNDIAIVLVALLSVLVTSVCSAANYDTSAARSYNSGWLPAKATWYGAPTGAGPNDNGTTIYIYTFACITFAVPTYIVIMLFSSIWICRRCLRLQECQPVPFLLHDVLRQRASVRRWRRLRQLL